MPELNCIQEVKDEAEELGSLPAASPRASQALLLTRL